MDIRTPGTGSAARAATTLAALAATTLLAALAYRSLSLAPTFDGAMNLQVAWNLAEGHGYIRGYGEAQPFPHEVQTNGPYVMAAALGYRLFGMGIVQSQLANLLFVVMLAMAAYSLGSRMRGRGLDGFLATAMVLATPSFQRFGFMGYGEVPALALALAAIAAYPWSGPTAPLRVALAGVLLSSAVITKTVMLACAVPIGLVMCLHVASREEPLAMRARLLALLALGFVATLFAWEGYRMASLGGLEAYQSWWTVQSRAITRQAGAGGGAGMVAVMDKAMVHFGALVRFLGVPASVVAAWLVLPFVLAGLVPSSRPHARWILAAVLGAAAAYFIWWLGLTPTAKAWHRRIFNGVLLVHLAWGLLGGALASAPGQDALRRRLAMLLPVAAACLAAAFLIHARVRIPVHDPGQLQRAVEVVRALPPDAGLHAAGWWSAPLVSLLAERPLLDINDAPPSALARGPVYLVVDSEGGHTRDTGRILAMYPATAMVGGDALPQVYRVDTRGLATVLPPTDLSSPVAFNALDDSHALGLNAPDRHGRWASADIALATLYRGETAVLLEIYVPPGTQYTHGRPPTVSVLVDGCGLPPLRTRPGPNQLRFPLAACAPRDGAVATVRIQSDALTRGTITGDDRALAYIARSIQLTRDAP